MRIAAALLATAVLSLCSAAWGQRYPAKPVHMVVPFGAGGPTDLQSRIFAEYFGPALGQSMVVENRTGDLAMIAHRYVAHQPPDGYTVLLSGDYVLVLPVASKSWDLDLARDFTYLGTTTFADTLLLSSAQAPYKTFDEFIEYAQSHPGKTNYAIVGLAPYAVVLRYINKQLKLNMTEVAYKSVPEARLATLRGDLNLYPDAPITAKEKDTRPLLFAGSRRNPQFPSVPNLSDGKLAALGLSVSSWTGMVGPGGLPDDVVAKLSTALLSVLKIKEFGDRMSALGAVPYATTPAELREKVLHDAGEWVKIARDIGLTPQ